MAELALAAPQASSSRSGSPWRGQRSPSPSKLARLTDGAAANADPKFYSEESVRRRFSLMQQPVVVAALDKLWSAANFDDSDAIIDNKEYIVMQGSWYTTSLALGIGLLFDPMGP